MAIIPASHFANFWFALTHIMLDRMKEIYAYPESET